MKKGVKLLITVGIILFLIPQLNAQERIIHGIVTTFDSIPLVGATIKVNSTKQTVQSDSLGNFSIGCEIKDKLKVSANGFSSMNVKLTGSTKFAAVNLTLRAGEKNLEYAYGYTKTTDRDRLSSLASITNKDIDFSIYTNMLEAITGRFPGVSIVNGEIIIRGNGTINGSSAALIVVDGNPVHSATINSINPSTVKRINIIKDGSSAIYGSQGAWGVVEITTKTGKD